MRSFIRQKVARVSRKSVTNRSRSNHSACRGHQLQFHTVFFSNENHGKSVGVCFEVLRSIKEAYIIRPKLMQIIGIKF